MSRTTIIASGTFISAETLIKCSEIPAVDAGPWRHWRVQAVRVYPLRLADAASKKKIFWFTVVAFRTSRIHGHLNQQENG